MSTEVIMMGGRTARFVYLEERIKIPENVKVEIHNKKVKVSGPKGSLEKDFSYAKNIIISFENEEIVLKAFMGRSREKAVLYSVASHIRNMITGVTKGFRYYLKIIFTHFPMSVSVSGDKVIISRFLGEKKDRVAKIIGDTKVYVKDKDIIVEGIDIEAVAQTAANIENAVKRHYFDKRVVMDGIYIYKKEVIEE
jgi:large subunit ribosomal protein L6